MAFHYPQKVLFKHCDPAGIVFYPRYFEMMNDCVEAFFDEVLHWPFEQVLETGGVPTGEISTRFVAPSRHGELLDLSLYVTDIGRASVGFEIDAHCQGALRFKTTLRLVHVDQTGPAPWPDAARTLLRAQKENEE